MSALPIAFIADRAARLRSFAVETHPPLVYALVAGGWSYSLLMLLADEAGDATLPASAPWVAVVFFLVLLYLRAIDEIKDLPYDRLHHPDRPLVRGDVSPLEVAGLAAGVALVVLAVSACLSPLLALLAALQLAYGLGLLLLERAWRRFRESILLNLCITFPVSAVLNAYVWLYLATHGATPPLQTVWPVLLLHVAVFLHMEFGRKLKWPQHAEPGENGYAQALGVGGAVAACMAFGLLACALASGVHARSGAGGLSVLPWGALLLSLAGLTRFWRDRACAQPRALKPWFGGAMVVFFLLNVLVARWPA